MHTLHHCHYLYNQVSIFQTVIRLFDMRILLVLAVTRLASSQQIFDIVCFNA